MSSSKNKYALTQFDFNPTEIKDEKIGEDLWKIAQDVSCQLKIDNRYFTYTLRKGFETNYRSGPRWIDEFAPKIGPPKIQVSWMIHDANYEGYLTQLEADNLLFHMLISGKLEMSNARFIYLGLRIFGVFKYKNTAGNKYVAFKEKTTPAIDSVSGEKRSATLDSSFDTNIIFEHESKKACHEKLTKIARENNFNYNQSDLDGYFD